MTALRKNTDPLRALTLLMASTEFEKIVNSARIANMTPADYARDALGAAMGRTPRLSKEAQDYQQQNIALRDRVSALTRTEEALRKDNETLRQRLAEAAHAIEGARREGEIAKRNFRANHMIREVIKSLRTEAKRLEEELLRKERDTP